jgi:hypothetical protein
MLDMGPFTSFRVTIPPVLRGKVCVELMTLPAERIVIMSPTHAAEPRVPVTAKLSKRFYDVLVRPRCLPSVGTSARLPEAGSPM